MRPIVLRNKTVMGIAVACAFASLALAAPARAQNGPPPSGASAVSQYAEIVPSAGGPTVPGIGTEKQAPLTGAGSKALKNAPPGIADSLAEIATSSTYGASVLPAAQAPARERKVVPPGSSVDATLRSTVEAMGSTGDARLAGLLIAVVVTTLAAVALSIRRARAL